MYKKVKNIHRRNTIKSDSVHCDSILHSISADIIAISYLTILFNPLNSLSNKSKMIQHSSNPYYQYCVRMNR